MYLGRTLAIVGTVYILGHVVVGALNCQENFCPGDRESDWVYEYTDDDGKRFVMVDNKPIPKEQYQERLGIGPYNRDQK
jgi:hypothetical protein